MTERGFNPAELYARAQLAAGAYDNGVGKFEVQSRGDRADAARTLRYLIRGNHDVRPYLASVARMSNPSRNNQWAINGENAIRLLAPAKDLLLLKKSQYERAETFQRRRGRGIHGGSTSPIQDSFDDEFFGLASVKAMEQAAVIPEEIDPYYAIGAFTGLKDVKESFELEFRSSSLANRLQELVGGEVRAFSVLNKLVLTPEEVIATTERLSGEIIMAISLNFPVNHALRTAIGNLNGIDINEAKQRLIGRVSTSDPIIDRLIRLNQQPIIRFPGK